MQVIAVSNPSSAAHRLAVARSLAVAIMLLLAGAALAWLSLGTSLVSGFRGETGTIVSVYHVGA